MQKRITGLHNNLRDIRESLDSEDKNTAGDKHETGRAMIQLEQESLGKQLGEAERMKQQLDKVNIRSVHTAIGMGSLVRTTKNDYFISISAGEFKNDANAIYCISMASPMGQLLMGKSAGDEIIFNTEKINILEIV
ncbi:MAG: 3-oxoacyl-ACP synthase [Flavobacteriaceae bacterium]